MQYRISFKNDKGEEVAKVFRNKSKAESIRRFIEMFPEAENKDLAIRSLHLKIARR